MRTEDHSRRHGEPAFGKPRNRGARVRDTVASLALVPLAGLASVMLMAACTGPSREDGPADSGPYEAAPGCHPQALRLAAAELGAQGMPRAALPPDVRERIRWRRTVLASCLSAAANVPRDHGPAAPRRSPESGE